MQENTEWHNHFSLFVGYTEVNWYSNIHQSLSGFRVQYLFSLNSHWNIYWNNGNFSMYKWNGTKKGIPGFRGKANFALFDTDIQFMCTLYNQTEQSFIVAFLSLLSWFTNYNDNLKFSSISVHELDILNTLNWFSLQLVKKNDGNLQHWR